MTGWPDYANCDGVDTDVFFPPRERPDIVAANITRAKRVCAGCMVRRQCLDYALANYIRDGVWGGTTPPERRRIRQQIRAAS